MDTMCEPPEMTKFKELVKPLVEYLQENYSPHHSIIINCDYAELVMGQMGTPFKIPNN